LGYRYWKYTVIFFQNYSFYLALFLIVAIVLGYKDPATFSSSLFLWDESQTIHDILEHLIKLLVVNFVSFQTCFFAVLFDNYSVASL